MWVGNGYLTPEQAQFQGVQMPAVHSEDLRKYSLDGIVGYGHFSHVHNYAAGRGPSATFTLHTSRMASRIFTPKVAISLFTRGCAFGHAVAPAGVLPIK